jgi:hypothetical protein
LVGCSGIDHQKKVLVATSSASFKLPLSKLVFNKVDIRGDPFEIVSELNTALKQSGFPLGLTIGGGRVLRRTHLKMENVTVRQVIDQMCVQLEISYWDNARLRELYLCDSKTAAFHPEFVDKEGNQTPAGPPQFAPSGFALLPFRAPYFDRTIDDLARERGLVP